MPEECEPTSTEAGDEPSQNRDPAPLLLLNETEDDPLSKTRGRKKKMELKQLSPTGGQISSCTRSRSPVVAPVQTLSHSPVPCLIMLLDSQPNEPSMACLTPVYHTQCLPKGSTTVLCKIKNVENRFSTKFSVHAAQLPNLRCYMCSPLVNVSSLTQHISVQVCNKSNKLLLLTPQLVITKLSLSKAQLCTNTVMIFLVVRSMLLSEDVN